MMSALENVLIVGCGDIGVRAAQLIQQRGGAVPPRPHQVTAPPHQCSKAHSSPRRAATPINTW